MTGEQVVETVMVVVMALICVGAWLRDRRIAARRSRRTEIHEPPSNVRAVDDGYDVRLDRAIAAVRGGRWV